MQTSVINGIEVADHSDKGIENTRKSGWYFDGRKTKCIYCGAMWEARLLKCKCRLRNEPFASDKE